jgi:hypothetical protein
LAGVAAALMIFRSPVTPRRSTHSAGKSVQASLRPSQVLPNVSF